MRHTPSVVIVGGGAAGLASAVGHLERGFRVRILESRKHLGGRAWSLDGDAHEIDNGPHVLLGCYRAFRRLLVALGTEDLFFHRAGLELTWLRPGGELLRLTRSRLPAPLHLVSGLLRLSGLAIGERFELLLSGLAPFLRLPPESMTVTDWLNRSGHDGPHRSLFFEPLCRAVMNEEPDRAEAAMFLRTLREAFRGGRRRSAMWVPTAPWRQILDEPALELCERNGVELELGKRLVALEAGEAAPRLRLDDGSVLAGHDRVVLALPWREAAQLDTRGAFAPEADRIEAAPLVSVHFALPAGCVPFDDPVVAFADGEPFHFFCRRPDAAGIALGAVPAAVLAGGAFCLDGVPSREIVHIALEQLRRFLGREQPWPDEVTDSAVVVRESRATIAPRPGCSRHRPAPGPTPVPGLWLAGDWTATGLPSTLEGAARSAFDPLDAQ